MQNESDSTTPKEALTARYHPSFGAIGPYILTREGWVNPAPNELHLVAPDGTKQEFVIIAKSPPPDDPVIIDRARFERLLVVAVAAKEREAREQWDRPLDTSATHLHVRDLRWVPSDDGTSIIEDRGTDHLSMAVNALKSGDLDPLP